MPSICRPVVPLSCLLAAVSCGLLCGCATGSGTVPPWASQVLVAVGLQSPAPPPPPEALIELHASSLLNAASDGVALPTVVQLRWLDDPAAFQRAGYERLAAGDGARELVLAPGRTLSLRERVPVGAQALGVAALFRSPAPGRWKLVFPLPAPQPIRLALHRCALVLVSGAAWEPPAGADRLGDLRCPSSE
ncbi:type VI secretion system lipoprotein TssJ [Rubrivivax gelatinosus]|uniref:Type VI secretion system protein VasD n=2 Tax=Rubrivivax gelatinosus TaxID=28068 RepID=I0HTN4_RUBGI|nr:type VI secretion system lipoprotein TssJ [Rubrivivax gelatinosus]BAL96371.1 hypothetical protein RGE_30320 [Rubrivivax gelatinosus IL144]